MPDDSLDVGISQVSRVLAYQLASVDSIQTKIGVLIGFAATSLTLLFSFGRSWVTGHVVIASISAGALLLSIAIFAASLMLTNYEQAPDPKWLVDLLDNPTTDKGILDRIVDQLSKTTTDKGVLDLLNKATTDKALKEKVIGAMWQAFDDNRNLIEGRFALVNWAIGFLVAGLGVFVVGVLVT